MSIITSLNIHKDEINRLGCQKFASEMNTLLTSFFSCDKVCDPSKVQGTHKRTMRPPVLTTTLKNILWNRPTSCMSAKVPGRLDICVGMPIMIKMNAATELCVTNGQEAFVVDWKADLGPDGKLMLDTLFVKLCCPPQDITLPDLPTNVVPVVADKYYGYYSLPTGWVVPIERYQVKVVPNFAMTDYAAQGKTRPVNIVDLLNCRNHQAMYTCLSRGSEASNTLILGPFDASLIQGALSGHLRQEYRHLEILDDITKLFFNEELPFAHQADRRQPLIKAYQDHFGKKHNPSQLPKPLKWTDTDFGPVDDDILAISKPSNKRGRDTEFGFPLSKKMKLSRYSKTLKAGVVWDSVNWSCGYDSAIVSLFSMWHSNPALWSVLLPAVSARFLSDLPALFTASTDDNALLHQCRNGFRSALHHTFPSDHPLGQNLTSMNDIWEHSFSADRPVYTRESVCTNCALQTRSVSSYTPVLNATELTHESVDLWLNCPTVDYDPCPTCGSVVHTRVVWNDQPLLIAFNLNGKKNISIDPFVVVSHGETRSTFALAAATYHGGSHYTTRLIKENKVWFHDGIETGNLLVEESVLSATDLAVCRDRSLANILYRIHSWNNSGNN